MKKYAALASPLLFSLLTVPVQAAPITEIWQAEVVNTSHTAAAAIGDILTWTVTYDDAGLYMSQYYDGSDGIANTADDTLHQIWDVQVAPYSSLYNVFSDAIWDFGDIFTKMEQVVFDSSLSLRDAYNFNQKLFYGADTRNLYEYVADHRDFFFYDNFGVNDTARFNVYYWYTTGSPESVRIDVSNFTQLQASVPEPGSLSLLLLGMVAVFARNSHKAKAK